MQDDRIYYSARAAMEYTLAAQAADAVARGIHTEIAEAYTQLAAIMAPPPEARLHLVT